MHAVTSFPPAPDRCASGATASGPIRASVPRATENNAPVTRSGSCSRTATKHPSGSAVNRTAGNSAGIADRSGSASAPCACNPPNAAFVTDKAPGRSSEVIARTTLTAHSSR